MPKKILLVEDEYSIGNLYQMILSSADFEILLATDGEQALKLAVQHPDLILLDIMLPKIDGIMVLKQLKQDNGTKDIPVVLLTNLGQESIIKKAFDEGAAGYFLKARLQPQDLVKQVKRFLDNPKLKLDFKSIAFD